MSVAPAIQVSGLSHVYERWGHRIQALRDVGVTIARGEWVTVVGPNGSGKSTFLGVVGGRLATQSGSVIVAGRPIDVMGPRELADAVYNVHQDPGAGTAPTLTVEEHLMLADHGWTGRGYLRRSEQLLDDFGLAVSPRQPVETLSGGQRQLLVLLMAKLRPAPVVLLDEPFAALDPVRARWCDDALEVLRRAGKTIVLVTHDLEYAISHGDRTLAMIDGQFALDVRGPDRSVRAIAAIWRPNNSAAGIGGA